MGNAQTNWDVGYERESKVQVCAQPVQYSQQSREQAMWEDLREGVVCACAHVCVNTCRCGGRCQVLRKWPRFCFFFKVLPRPAPKFKDCMCLGWRITKVLYRYATLTTSSQIVPETHYLYS